MRNRLSQRRAGVLLHPTSLPDMREQGGLGADAFRFVDFLAAAGFSVWQMLPVGPTDAAGSPYALRSVHAGGPHLLDAGAAETLDEPHALDAFVDEERDWLVPYALFEHLARRYGGAPWWSWPAPQRAREPGAMGNILAQEEPAIRLVYTEQRRFAAAWQALRQYANGRGIELLGDLPFYTDLNSADVWWNRHLFRVDADGRPEAVAGTPPDYFAEDGQLWGNPLYDWQRMESDGFRWWVDRIGLQLRRFDILRIDHFRALESHWEIPAGARTARDGSWSPTPGAQLLEALRVDLGSLPFVAEDLGSITPAVHELRHRFGLPGMIVLQFAFDGSPDNPYLPENHCRHAVVYTGTHDNDTTVGWYRKLDGSTRAYVAHCLAAEEADIPAAMIRTAYASPAELAIIPMQDLLQLGSEARMNTPGTTSENWRWRFGWSDLSEDLTGRYRALAEEFGRFIPG
jgi:4-alpha-glucanotransferase